MDDGLYKKASIAVDNWLEYHRGETFDLDMICRQLEIRDAHKRNLISQKLAYEVKRGNIEKINRTYRYIDNTIIRMDWRNSKGAVNLPINWPQGTDGTRFGFDGHIYIPQKGMIVLAGVTNTGKSVFMRNLLFKNMDVHHCIYFSSETSEDDFAEYVSRMTWANPTNENGDDKFELIWREKDFKDVLQPNAVNIIDWFNIYNEFYRIGELLDGMKSVLDKGILVVAIQKDPLKGLGVGGMWAEHKASLYMTMDFNRITVEKAKKWYEYNPNHQSWGFNIVDEGTHFNNIRPLVKCFDCKGSGKNKGGECFTCHGTGYIEKVNLKKDIEELW
jgi:hypothetical protein